VAAPFLPKRKGQAMVQLEWSLVGRHNGILLAGNNNEIYGHFTSDDEAGPFQWPPFFFQS
jgi:hypothetical protein